jgi:hypothetical protein
MVTLRMPAAYASSLDVRILPAHCECVLDGETCAAAGFDDADTGTAARTVNAAEVRRRLAAVGGVGWVN